MQKSKNWAKWRAAINPGTCLECFTRNGKIFSYDELTKIGEPQLHPNCKCWLEQMLAIAAGHATELGMNGADWWLYYLHELPGYYITKKEAYQMGWDKLQGNLAEIAPGYMISGGIYKNKKKVLPQTKNRTWYEIDINYHSGYRNDHRIVFSNDGLIFVTYDHYKNFIEIIGEDSYGKDYFRFYGSKKLDGYL